MKAKMDSTFPRKSHLVIRNILGAEVRNYIKSFWLQQFELGIDGRVFRTHVYCFLN